MSTSLFNLLVFISIILVQIVFVVLRLNHNIEWLWSLVLIPYWLLSVIVILIYVNIVVSFRESQNAHEDSHDGALFSVFGSNGVGGGRYPSYIYYGINLAAVLAFIILVDLQLDLEFTTWSIVFIPLWTALGIDLLWIIWESNRNQENWRPRVTTPQQPPLTAPLTFASHYNDTSDYSTYYVSQQQPSMYVDDYRSPYKSPSYQQHYRIPPQVLLALIRVVLLYGSMIAFSVVLALELDHVLDTRWEYIFIPVWLVLFIWLLSLAYDLVYKYFLRRFDNRPYKPWSQLLMEFVLFVGLLAFALFLQQDLIEHESIDPLVVFSPLFIAFFILFWIVWSIYYFTPIPGTMGVALPSSPMHWAFANTSHHSTAAQNGVTMMSRQRFFLPQ